MTIIAYSPLETDNPDDLLHHLIFGSASRSASAVKVVWDLATLAKAVLSMLPEDVRLELSRPPHRSRWGNYKLYYAPEKVFSVGKNGSEINVYDLSQYFPDSAEPADRVGLQEKADCLQKVLADLGIPRPTTLASPVAMFKGQEVLKAIEDTIPTIFDAPESLYEAYDLALQCTPREWVSNYQIGHFTELHGYDIGSAYPAQAAKLLHLADCTFHRSTTMHDTAYYGFLVGDFTVYPNHPLAYCSPFLADRGDGTLVNFVGTKRNHVCYLDEVRTLYCYEMGEFRLRNGWFISPSSGVCPRTPLSGPIAQLFADRSNNGSLSTDLSELRSYILKRVMNGIVGKMLESHKDDKGNIIEYGKLYNPIYHAICTNQTRLQVFEFLVNNKVTREELVHVGVDGIKSTRFIPLPAKNGLGKWRYAGCEPAIVLSPGAVLTQHRNFKRTGYVDMVVDCLAHPNSYKFGLDAKDKINMRTIFLNQNRIFSNKMMSGKDLLESQVLSDPVRL